MAAILLGGGGGGGGLLIPVTQLIGWLWGRKDNLW